MMHDKYFEYVYVCIKNYLQNLNQILIQVLGGFPNVGDKPPTPDFYRKILDIRGVDFY